MEKLSFKEKAGFGIGEIASNIIWMSVMFFLPNFYTDTFGLSAGVVGTMFLIVRIFDAINDPLMGMIADRTNTKWGKFRPYILWMSVPYGIGGVLMFITPDFSETGKIIYAYATYTGMMIIYTAIMIPYSALSGVMTSDYLDRTSLSSFRFVGAFTGGLIIQGLTISLVDYFGNGDDTLGYQITMSIFAVTCVFLFLVTFFTTKERIKPVSDAKNKFVDDLKDLMKNIPWIVLFLVSLVTLIYVGIRSAVLVYYFEYFIGNKELASTFMVSGTLAIIVSLMFTKQLTKIFDKRKLYFICMTIVGISALGFYFVSPTDIIIIFVLQIIFSFASGPTMPLLWSMLADTADYSEWKTGRRATGLVFSASTFAQKAGGAVGGAVALWILAYYGYQANTVQSPEALNGMVMMMSIYPAIGAFICAGIVLMYKLDINILKQVEADLKSRRPAEESSI